MNVTNNFIQKFITSREIESKRESCLMIALTDARKLAGRDIASGEIKNNLLISAGCDVALTPYSLIGLINYLLVLEMIGEIFKTSRPIDGFNQPKDNKIYKALKQFSPLPLCDKDIYVIISLRNSLAHNYGLINIPKCKKEKEEIEDLTKLHKFTLNNLDTAELIVYPELKLKRDEIFSNKSNDTSTIIGYIKMVELIESVYEKLKAELIEGNVELALKDGLDELKARFTLRN